VRGSSACTGAKRAHYPRPRSNHTQRKCAFRAAHAARLRAALRRRGEPGAQRASSHGDAPRVPHPDACAALAPACSDGRPGRAGAGAADGAAALAHRSTAAAPTPIAAEPSPARSAPAPSHRPSARSPRPPASASLAPAQVHASARRVFGWARWARTLSRGGWRAITSEAVRAEAVCDAPRAHSKVPRRSPESDACQIVPRESVARFHPTRTLHRRFPLGRDTANGGHQPQYVPARGIGGAAQCGAQLGSSAGAPADGWMRAGTTRRGARCVCASAVAAARWRRMGGWDGRGSAIAGGARGRGATAAA